MLQATHAAAQVEHVNNTVPLNQGGHSPHNLCLDLNKNIVFFGKKRQSVFNPSGVLLCILVKFRIHEYRPRLVNNCIFIR